VGQYLDTPSGTLHWIGYGGTGPIILLVHGLGGSCSNWDAVGPGLARFGDTMAVDLPGYGLSPPAADWRIPTMVGALHDFIDGLDRPVTLVGNSMGGLVSEMVAARRPDRVQALLLVSPATPPRLPDPKIHWPTARRLAAQATPGLGTLISWYLRSRHSPEELVRLGLEWVTHKPGRVPLPVIEALVASAKTRSRLPWSAEAVPGTARSIASTWLRRSDFVSMIREIRAPTLVVQGLGDRIVSPSAVEWLCWLRPDWELIQMEDTGHTPQLDAPVRFIDTVTPWLEKRLRNTA
jgi:pimeloyl-ACP methyl ester carboxylesterase